MYTEKMNIYKQKTARFMVFFTCSVLVFFGIVTGDYWFLGSLAVLVLVIHLYTSSLEYTIGHTAEALVFGLRKQNMILFQDIEEIAVENIDYMGKFGGYGYRRFRKRSAYVFNDSGNFLCVKTADKNYFFSIDDKEYWTDWLQKRTDLSKKASIVY